MKKPSLIVLAGLMLLGAGCGSKESDDARGKSPAFMFWCYRDEIVSDEFHVPDMATPAAATYIQNRLRTIPGFARSRCDLNARILTVSYKSSTVRKMNFEEAIALSGFSVNGRPAAPNATLPEGLE